MDTKRSECVWNMLPSLGLAADILRHREADVLRWRRRHCGNTTMSTLADFGAGLCRALFWRC